MIKIKKQETDLYKPVKKYFESLGYKVNAEVVHCDMTAYKDGRLIVVELKTSFNMTVLYQALDRQMITNEVYIAVPKPARRMSRYINKMIHIAESLNLGLITVASGRISERSAKRLTDPARNPQPVEVLTEPMSAEKQKNNRRSRSVIKEISERTIDNNIGGSTREKITTAYTEKTLRIAVMLKAYGAMSAARLIKEHGCCESTWEILYFNHYGWFDKTGNGKYALNEKGVQALSDPKYKDHITALEKELILRA